MRACFLGFVAALVPLASCVGAPDAGAPTAASPDGVAWDFEGIRVGELPPRWRVAQTGWTAAVVDNAPADPERGASHRAVRVDLPDGPRQGYFGNALTSVDARALRGKVVRLRARVRDERPLEGDSARLWLRFDRPAPADGFLGSTEDLPLDPGRWSWREVTGAVPNDATGVVLGFVVPGPGPAWLDDVTLEVLTAPPGGWPPLLDRIALHSLENEHVHAFRLRSNLLSDEFGRDVEMVAGVVAPPGRERDASLPIAYDVHGFGGDYTRAWRGGASTLAAMRSGREPELLHVYLDANCPLGHHEFADSANNGPWERALVEELIPALEARFGGLRDRDRRFVTGHSSGGWSALWLQLRRPELFGGCWATAPDPVDFRDFSGVDLYAAQNLYRDSDGVEQYISEADGLPNETFENYTRNELESRRGSRGLGGQMSSFDAVFSPRDWDGRPKPMYDRETGAIDPGVVAAWRRYDIGLLVRERWNELQPLLAGRVRVWCGELDDYRLDGAVKLLDADQRAQGGGMDILIVPGRDHGSLFAPHEEHWPDGMLVRIHREMAAAAQADTRPTR
ncbi:MAG: alpha/beta hydrolase-fold protein [Planctomycetota bacterium]